MRELKRIQHEELNGRKSLELEGAQDPSKAGLQLPRFRLGLIDQDTEEYDERVSQSCDIKTSVSISQKDIRGLFPLVFLGQLDSGCRDLLHVVLHVIPPTVTPSVYLSVYRQNLFQHY